MSEGKEKKGIRTSGHLKFARRMVLDVMSLLVLKVSQFQKDFLVSSILPKKTKKKFDFTTMIPQVDLFSSVFWEKLKTPKRHFENN